jgi:DNA invertase Pin-like site-specific DNA recombinase
MKQRRRVVAYVRVGNADQLSNNRQRDELHAKFGDTHQIVGEYRDEANGNLGVEDRPALKKLLKDAAKGEFDVLLCTDLARFTRRLTPQIMMAIREAGVMMVTADGAEIGFADLVAHTLLQQSAKTYSELMSERTKQGKRISKAAGPKKRRTPKK